MEGTAEKAPKNKKKIWVAGGLIVALVLIVYFSFFYPPVANDEGQGSIGAAKKYRSEQITDKDVQFAKVEKADEATIKEMESAAQNLGKAAEQMGRNTIASKFSSYAANAAGALDRAAKLAREGVVAKEWAIDAAKAGTECYAALSSLLEAKGASEAKWAAIKPAAAKAELTAMVVSIGANALASLDAKRMDAKLAENSQAPRASFSRQWLVARRWMRRQVLACWLRRRRWRRRLRKQRQRGNWISRRWWGWSRNSLAP